MHECPRCGEPCDCVSEDPYCLHVGNTEDCNEDDEDSGCQPGASSTQAFNVIDDQMVKELRED